MQSLDVISINIWSIIISLCNLVILFWIMKKFLYRPVRVMLDKRRAEIDGQYAAAREAQKNAEEARERYGRQLEHARSDADEILRKAAENAERRSGEILSSARERAGDMLRQARDAAELERRQAQEDVRREIVSVSAALAEKLLEREVNAGDHRALIASFMEKMGDGDD